MTTTQDLMEKSLLEVFGQRDAEKRLATMRAIYTADITFSDSDGVVRGIEAVSAKVTSLLAHAPRFTFAKASSVHVVQDLGMLAWQFGPSGAEPVVRGTDVALIVGNRISALYTYLSSD